MRRRTAGPGRRWLQRRGGQSGVGPGESVTDGLHRVDRQVGDHERLRACVSRCNSFVARPLPRTTTTRSRRSPIASSIHSSHGEYGFSCQSAPSVTRSVGPPTGPSAYSSSKCSRSARRAGSRTKSRIPSRAGIAVTHEAHRGTSSRCSRSARPHAPHRNGVQRFASGVLSLPGRNPVMPSSVRRLILGRSWHEPTSRRRARAAFQLKILDRPGVLGAASTGDVMDWLRRFA